MTQLAYNAGQGRYARASAHMVTRITLRGASFSSTQFVMALVGAAVIALLAIVVTTAFTARSQGMLLSVIPLGLSFLSLLVGLLPRLNEIFPRHKDDEHDEVIALSESGKYKELCGRSTHQRGNLLWARRWLTVSVVLAGAGLLWFLAVLIRHGCLYL